MSVNGIGTAGYPLTGYTARKMERSAEPGTVGFMETVEEKATQGKAADQDEKAFEMAGRGAPRLNKQLKGETENFDILGSTVESAIQATKKALYDFEHPVVYTSRSIEVQQAGIKEGEFYRAFLEKLEQL